MFTCYGWANVGVSREHIDPFADNEFELEEQANEADEKLFDELEGKIKEIENAIKISFFRHLNYESGLLTIVSNHNHRYQPVIDLFQWISEHGKGSHGLLFVLDDEDQSRAGIFDNCYRIWKLLNGQLLEIDDPFFSPYIPTVEKRFSENQFQEEK